MYKSYMKNNNDESRKLFLCAIGFLLIIAIYSVQLFLHTSNVITELASMDIPHLSVLLLIFCFYNTLPIILSLIGLNIIKNCIVKDIEKKSSIKIISIMMIVVEIILIFAYIAKEFHFIKADINNAIEVIVKYNVFTPILVIFILISIIFLCSKNVNKIGFVISIISATFLFASFFGIENINASSDNLSLNGEIFSKKSYQYDNRIADVTAYLCEKAGSRNDSSIKDAYDKFGLKDIKTYNYDWDELNELDILSQNAYSFGHKSIKVDGEKTEELLVVTARGSVKLREYIKDYIKGDEIDFLDRKVYENTYDFYSDICKNLEDYIIDNKLNEEDSVKILVTGYSLGGAAANLVAADLKYNAYQLGLNISTDDIYAYTFGAIKTLTTDDNVSLGYEYIHNIYNINDSFGPNGNLSYFNASSPNSKFGHTDLYDLGEEKHKEDGLSTANHNIANYRNDITNGKVKCLLKKENKKYNKDVSLALDVSGSMEGEPLEELIKASNKFCEKISNSHVPLGACTFSFHATIASSSSTEYSKIKKSLSELNADGGTNIEEALTMAASNNSAMTKKHIIVLMSDGKPTIGLSEEELIEYANDLREKGYLIYTLGFLSELENKESAADVLRGIANEGCYFEVRNANDLKYFFEDIAAQVNGEKYFYIKIECPVDVSVSHDGSKLSSVDNQREQHTKFGSLTFEGEGPSNTKVLRLKEGSDYDIKIEGTGNGSMTYSIGFMDDDGEYSDIRSFENIEINNSTQVNTKAKVGSETKMYVDNDGDGKAEKVYVATENNKAKLVNNSRVCWLIFIAYMLLLIIPTSIWVRRSVKQVRNFYKERV